MLSRTTLALALLLGACGEPDEGVDAGTSFQRDSGVPAGDGGSHPDATVVQLIQVQSVSDGDTIHVSASVSLFTPDNKPLAGESIRFLGIDAPEVAHPPAPADCYGPESQTWARDLLQGRTITLEYDLEPSCTLPIPQAQAENCHLRDRFGRLLAYVKLSDGRVVNELSLSAGMSRSFRAFPHRDTDKYNALEAAAQRARLGMWTCP